MSTDNTILSKEEILYRINKRIATESGMIGEDEVSFEDFLDGLKNPIEDEMRDTYKLCNESMDEYAEQTSIEFGQWICKNGYDSIQICVDPCWQKSYNSPPQTSAQLFKLFLQSKQKTING